MSTFGLFWWVGLEKCSFCVFSASVEHQSAVKNHEAIGTPTCIICKASGETSLDMMQKCEARQKQKILGNHRKFSCDMCDVHLSEQDWLEKHMTGEKHRWIVDRVEQLLPVQFINPDMMVIQKSRANPFAFNSPEYWQEFRCVVCKVGFSPLERYKKHIGSLFHLRRCAGEEVQWVDDLS